MTELRKYDAPGATQEEIGQAEAAIFEVAAREVKEVLSSYSPEVVLAAAKLLSSLHQPLIVNGELIQQPPTTKQIIEQLARAGLRYPANGSDAAQGDEAEGDSSG